MSALAFTNQEHRLRMVVGQALDGTVFEGARAEENGRHLVIEARRQDGRKTAVRFRAISDASAANAVPAGAALRLRGVQAGPTGCLPLGWFIPALRGIPRGVSRVRIDAGDARLDILCQDAEWWEDDAPPGGVT